jgi:hypothetical protein
MTDATLGCLQLWETGGKDVAIRALLIFPAPPTATRSGDAKSVTQIGDRSLVRSRAPAQRHLFFPTRLSNTNFFVRFPHRIDVNQREVSCSIRRLCSSSSSAFVRTLFPPAQHTSIVPRYLCSRTIMTKQLEHMTIKGSLVTCGYPSANCKMGGSRRQVPCGRAKVHISYISRKRSVADVG